MMGTGVAQKSYAIHRDMSILSEFHEFLKRGSKTERGERGSIDKKLDQLCPETRNKRIGKH